MAEKTEEATPKKLRDARKKGQVSKSQDFPSAFTFIVSVAATLALSGYLYEYLSVLMISMFKSVGTDIDIKNRIGGILTELFRVILECSLPILALTIFSGLLVSFIVVGPVFSLEVIKPNLKRFNPVENIKNIFKFKTIFELLKSIFKITGAIVLIYSVIWDSLPQIVATVGISIRDIAELVKDFLYQVIIRVGIFFLVIAVADLIYQKRNFAKEMKMEKFEVKQEYKDTEGDPHLKSKRKQIAQEIAYQEGPSGVKKARTVITNPTHLAIALGYEPEKDSAPKILTMGAGPLAEKIIAVATEFNVPIMRNVQLAHLLFTRGKAGRIIPVETFDAVAEILKWLERSKKKPLTIEEIFKR